MRRASSKPLGSTVSQGASAYSDSINYKPRAEIGDPELFSDRPGDVAAPTGRIMDHAENRLRELKRIESQGQVVYKTYEPSMRPGWKVNGVDGSDYKIWGACRSVIIEANTQDVSCEFA